MGITSRLALGLFRSRACARRLFGGTYPELTPGDRYFDSTTLALRSRIGKRIPRASRVLEVGTGSFAILAGWMVRELECEVVCSELDPQTAERAKLAARGLGGSLEVRQGSLFAGSPGPFDFVVFNPPYLPTAVGQERELAAAHRSQWDGGAGGLDVVREFLAALDEHSNWGVALLGLNSAHVQRAEVLELIASQASLELVQVWRTRWLPTRVFELRRVVRP